MTNATIEVFCPGDGRSVGTVPNMSAAEVVAEAERLRAAQPEWEALGFAGRRRWLGVFRDWLLDNADRLHRMIQSESGRAWGDIAMGEVAVAVDVLNYYSAHAQTFLAAEHPRPHNVAMATKRLEVTHRPYQLVGVITPWNAQIANGMLDVPPALMAGCAVLSKPSEVTPLTWSEIVRGWSEIGAPPVFGCVTGDGRTGAAVVDTVDMIHFTGSTATGRKIAARAGERLIPASLELGGKDAAIVCADADLDRAVPGIAWGALHNGGQICISVERVYVEDPIYDEFVERLTALAASLRHGMDLPDTYATDFGAMLTETQVGIVDRHVQDALAKGAVATTGGRPSAGQSFEPTVLAGVDHSMDCMREETFGPTIPVMRVHSIDEAIALANDSAYGLAGSVWTRDEAKGRAIARRLTTGSVAVNNALVSVFQLSVPMAGWGDSGLGARNGREGILRFTRPQSVVSERIAATREVYWYPRSARRDKAMGRITRLLGARDWQRRIGRRPA